MTMHSFNSWLWVGAVFVLARKEPMWVPVVASTLSLLYFKITFVHEEY